MDSLEALGLKNHMNFSTHHDNITLDLVISDEISKLKPIHIKPGPFLLDHSMISDNVSDEEIMMNDDNLESNLLNF